MADQPSTGDPVLDEIVRSQFTEVIAITRQILGDRLGEIVDGKVLDTLSAVIPTQLWRPMANLIVAGIQKGWITDAQDPQA